MAGRRIHRPPVRDVPGVTARAITLDPPIDKQPIITTATPNPNILNRIEPIAREIVLDAAAVGQAEPYCFGRNGCKPLVIAGDDSGSSLVLDLLWGVGEMSTICNGAGGHSKALYMPDIGFVSVSGASHEHFTGTAGQSASTILTALKGTYPAYANKAHSVITMQDGWNLNIIGFHDGVKVFDPRQSPQANVFTENPALILADILSRSGYTIDWDSVAEAANYGDEGIDAYESPLAARWKVHGQITNRQELRHWVHVLAQYAGCYIDVRGGSAIFVVDKARASNHTVVAADIVEGTERLKRRGSKDMPTQVTVNWGVNFGTYSAAYGTSGGAGTESTLSMPYWDNATIAGRKAKEIYNKAQHEIEYFEFVARDKSLIRTLGDVGTITYAPVGLSAVDMALVENVPIERGRWKRKYIPYDATDYAADATGVTDGGADDALNNPFYPPTGPTPALSFDTVTTDSPNWQRIKIDFSPQTWAYLKDYKVTVTTTADTATILYSEYIAKGSETGSPATITTYTDFATDFTTSPINVYQVNVYLRSIVTDWQGNEVLGDPGTATIENTYATTAKWLGNGDSPSNYYQIGGGTSVSPADWDALIPGTGSGDTYQKLTLVFCVYPVQLGDTGQWYIFSSDNSNFTVGNYDLAGGIWVAGRDWTNSTKSINTTPAGSPSDYGGLIPNQWNTVMIAYDGTSSASPETTNMKIWANGSQVYNGAWGGKANMNPMSYNGYSWVGHGDPFTGSEDDGMNCYLSYVWANEEYLDPATYWSSFFDGNNKPIDIGADGSSVTGSPPVSFFPDADFTNNQGTGPNWTEIGTVPAAPSSPTD